MRSPSNDALKELLPLIADPTFVLTEHFRKGHQFQLDGNEIMYCLYWLEFHQYVFRKQRIHPQQKIYHLTEEGLCLLKNLSKPK